MSKLTFELQATRTSLLELKLGEYMVGERGIQGQDGPPGPPGTLTSADQATLDKAVSDSQAAASAASGSAAAAGNSATNAATSATTAANARDAASASATAAGASATAAGNSQAAAAASETNAAASAAAALASQNAAKTSETNSKASETNASGSAGTANAAAQAASNSQIAAKTSETNAKTSETNAAASASAIDARLVYMSGHNRIINGAALVQQYAAKAFTNGVSGYGGVDRFYSGNSAGGQFTQFVGTISGRPAITQNVDVAVANAGFAGANLWLGIQQRIEGFNCYDMVGGKGSLSFLFSTNVPGLYSVQLYDPTSTQSYVTTFNAIAGVTKVNIPAIDLPASLNIAASLNLGLLITIGCINQGTNQTSLLNQWQAGNLISAAGAVNWAASVNNWIAATEIQFESGPVVTQFERRPFEFELLLSQRYYVPNMAAFLLSNGGGSFGGALGYFPYPVRMRVAPTITVANMSGPATAFVIANTPSPALASFQFSSPQTNGAYAAFTFTANAEL